MLKQLISILSICSIFLLPGCFIVSTTPEVLIKTEFTGDGIAVLNFTRQSSSSISDLGKLAADKLTDALFLEGKYKVIDRSVVNEALISLDIKTTELLSREDILRLGEITNANYLVLGRVQYFTKQEFLYAGADKELYISFRIIAVSTGEVVGIGTYKSTFQENLIEELNSAIYYLVRRMI